MISNLSHFYPLDGWNFSKRWIKWGLDNYGKEKFIISLENEMIENVVQREG